VDDDDDDDLDAIDADVEADVEDVDGVEEVIVEDPSSFCAFVGRVFVDASFSSFSLSWSSSLLYL
jgi:hypothetical protein